MDAGQPKRALFHWTLKREGIIAPDERLPWPQTIAVGVQHIFAMFGATVLAPIIMGFDPNTAILFSGIGTLIFFFVVGGRIPSYLGSSFSFIAVVIAATAYAGTGPNPNLGVALGGIIAAGAVYALIGLAVMAVGYRWIEVLMPPVVTGAVVAVIGLNLAPVAVGNLMPGGAAASEVQFATLVGLLTVVAVGAVAVYAPGMLRRLPVLLGGVIGYVVYLVLANGLGWGTPIDFTALGNAAWFGAPNLTAPTFEPSALTLIAPVAIILVAENLGHVKAVAAMTGRNLDPYLGRAFLGDGIATMVAGAGGGTGVTTYAENIGVMAVTKIYSTLVFVIAALVAIAMGFSPKFGALIGTIPGPVLGGLSIVLFGLIAATGARIWVQNRVDFSNSRNLITAAVALTLGAGNLAIKVGDFELGGIGTATFGAIIIYQLLRDPRSAVEDPGQVAEGEAAEAPTLV
ncbi:MAG TPA: solute carrier family 23 protein [Candidatus Limnocylindrales bacterium]|nr:solute carrier family 23 protein [Candidatus Limnocylindrales bacterium]